MQQRNTEKEFKVQVSELLMTAPLSYSDPLPPNSLQDITAGLQEITMGTTTSLDCQQQEDVHPDQCNINSELHNTTSGLQHTTLKKQHNSSDLQNTTLVLQGTSSGLQEPSLDLQNVIMSMQGTSLGSEPIIPVLQDTASGLQDSAMTTCPLDSTMGSIIGSQAVTAGLQEATLGLQENFKGPQGSECTLSHPIDTYPHPHLPPRKMSLPVLHAHSPFHVIPASSSLPRNGRLLSPKLHKFHSLSEVESNDSLQIPPFQPHLLSRPLPSPPATPVGTPPTVTPCPPQLLLPSLYLPPKSQTHPPPHSSSPPPLPPKPPLAFLSEEPPRYLPFPISNALHRPSLEMMEGHNEDGCWSIQSKQLQQIGTESIITAQSDAP